VNWGERGHVLVTRDERVVYCRVVGIGNMNNSQPFEVFVRRMQDEGFHEFILDFSRCDALDSTFLGIVLGLQLGRGDGGVRPMVTAVNVGPAVLRTLAEVGIDRLIRIVPEPVQLPEIPMRRLATECTEQERLGTMLAAHETLCSVGEENLDRFGEFVSLLRAELRSAEERRARQRAGAAEEDRK